LGKNELASEKDRIGSPLQNGSGDLRRLPEQSDDVEKRMQPRPVESADKQNRGLSFPVEGRCRRVLFPLGGGVLAVGLRSHDQVVQATQEPAGVRVMPSRQDRQSNQGSRNHKGDPPPLEELQGYHGGQDEDGKDQAHAVDAELLSLRGNLMADGPPMPHPGKLRKKERDEHMDTVKDNQQRHGAAGENHNPCRQRPDDHDAVLGDEAITQDGELRREPPVQRHVRQHSRPIEKARLRRHKKEGRFRCQRRKDKRNTQTRRPAPRRLLKKEWR